ncbi:SKP1-like protein 21 isoform X4 [Populus nigra]|uniref:SKP1-like protein 21 isoform X4 n=1 Tax=Populus nigra TaxID=3691 RepID=UPI002B27424E|nr:SKP1-like protein 21 isoform X4 [Populus nigra]
MPEAGLAVVKPEMKSYIWLQTADGSVQQVEEEVAMFCPMICREIIQAGMGSSKNHAISLPQRVNPAILGLILDYCRFHQVPGHSNKERKTFDEKFIRMDTKRLCELTSAADSLQLKPLVDLTSRALARIIEGKTPEEIRETFHLPDDLTENVDVEDERADNRSVEDLLSFINGEDGDSKGGRNSKNKKKNRRRKEQAKDSSSNNPNENQKKESDTLPSVSPNDEVNDILAASPSKTSNFQDCSAVTFSPKLDFDDADIDDDLDPAMKEELDREVEDFARRLNSDWPERMQEILSLDQKKRPVPLSMNGNGTSRRYSGQGCRLMCHDVYCVH